MFIVQSCYYEIINVSTDVYLMCFAIFNFVTSNISLVKTFVYIYFVFLTIHSIIVMWSDLEFIPIAFDAGILNFKSETLADGACLFYEQNVL